MQRPPGSGIRAARCHDRRPQPFSHRAGDFGKVRRLVHQLYVSEKLPPQSLGHWIVAELVEKARRDGSRLGQLLEPPPVSPARGSPADWGELVQTHDNRNVFQVSPDELPVTGSRVAVRTASEEGLKPT
jgi:hypothetical protein